MCVGILRVQEMDPDEENLDACSSEAWIKNSDLAEPPLIASAISVVMKKSLSGVSAAWDIICANFQAPIINTNSQLRRERCIEMVAAKVESSLDHSNIISFKGLYYKRDIFRPSSFIILRN